MSDRCRAFVRTTGLLLSAMVSLAACTTAEPTAIQRELLSVARDAEQRRDFGAAAVEYRRLAQAGVVQAQFAYADILRDGRGVPTDETEAVRWYLAAAKGGEVRAMRDLGQMYAQGLGAPRDIAEAGRWFAVAAERGDDASRYELAKLVLADGNGDAGAAVAAMRKAARNGYVDAQLDLAGLYEKGGLVPRDVGEAQRWYRIAATALALEVERGSSGAMAKLAALYSDGKGVPQDTARAIALYRQLADGGRVSAIVDLARLYQRGAPGLPADATQAAIYYERAAGLGQATSAYELGKMLLRGEGLRPDPARAARMFERALELGETRALLYLGDIYADATELRDVARSADYYGGAGTAGEPKGYFRLAELHERAIIDPPDMALALALYELAGAGGYGRGSERADRLRAKLSQSERARAAALKAEWIARRGGERL